jgi:hypothetical protein
MRCPAAVTSLLESLIQDGYSFLSCLDARDYENMTELRISHDRVAYIRVLAP